MSWIKHIIVDLCVTAIVVIAAFSAATWATWALLVYTPFLVVMKFIGFLAVGFTRTLKRDSGGVPNAVYHLLYAANLSLLAFGGLWLLAGQWAAIWLLSIATEWRLRPTLRAA